MLPTKKIVTWENEEQIFFTFYLVFLYTYTPIKQLLYHTYATFVLIYFRSIPM